MGDTAANSEVIDNLCQTNEYDMESYNKTDFMMITKTLKEIYIVAIDYKEGVLDYPSTYQRVRDLYSYYMCKVKRKIQEDKDFKKFVENLTIALASAIMVFFTVLMIYELYFAIKGKEYNTPIITCIVLIIVFNPVRSVIMLVRRAFGIKTSGGVTKERAREVERLEKLLLKAVDTECQGDNEQTFAACISEFITIYENNVRDHLTARKSERVRDIITFIENCRSFCKKSNSLEYNADMLLSDRIISLTDMILYMDDVALSAVMDADISSEYGIRTLYFKESNVARRRCADIIMHYEPNASRDDFVSYDTYFVHLLNSCIHELQKSVLKFWNQTQGLTGIIYICDSSDIDINAPYDFTLCKRKLIDMMIIIRRLRYLRVPEYDYILEALCGTRTDLMNFVLTYDSAVSNLSDAEIMANICSLLLSSEYFFDMINNSVTGCSWSVYSKNVDVMGETVLISYPKLVSCTDSTTYDSKTGCLMALPVDVKAIYKSKNANYIGEDTKLFMNVKKLISTIHTTRVDEEQINKKTEHSLEWQFILDAIFLKFKYEVSTIELNSMDSLIRDRARRSALSINIDVFTENMLYLIRKSVETNIISEDKTNLTQTNDNDIPNQHKYIDYATFSEKMSSLSEENLGQFAINLEKAKEGVVFMTSHMEDINDTSEKNIIMSGIYGEAVIFYIVISALYLFSYLVKTISGETIDSLISKFITRRKIRRL